MRKLDVGYQLWCGHRIDSACFGKMYRKGEVICPACGMAWRGYQVIDRDKGEPKRELMWALQRAREKTRDHYKK